MSANQTPTMLRDRAASLGISIPEGATESEISELVRRGVDATIEEGQDIHNLHAADLPRVALLRRVQLSHAKQGIQLAEMMRRFNFHVGSVVGRNGDPWIVYALLLRTNDMWLLNVTTGESRSVAFALFDRNEKRYTLAYPVLYTPRRGYASPLIALRPQPDEGISAYRERTEPLISRIAPLLSEQEQYFNEYGCFWLKAAADRIAAELAIQPAPSQTLPRQETREKIWRRHKAQLRGRPGFCRFCRHPLQWAISRACPVCARRNPKPKAAFCILCSAELPKQGTVTKYPPLICRHCE